MNSIIISGYLARDPELRSTPSGKQVATFTVGAKRLMGKEVQTDFIDCSAWEGSGVNIEKYFKKGDFILVRGYLSVRSWKDDEGKGHKIVEVIVQEWSFGGKRAETQDTQKAEETAQNDVDDNGEFIPF